MHKSAPIQWIIANLGEKIIWTTCFTYVNNFVCFSVFFFLLVSFCFVLPPPFGESKVLNQIGIQQFDWQILVDWHVHNARTCTECFVSRSTKRISIFILDALRMRTNLVATTFFVHSALRAPQTVIQTTAIQWHLVRTANGQISCVQ